MRISERQIATACIELLQERKLTPHEISRAVLGFLTKKHWMHRSDCILQEIDRALNALQRIVLLTVTSARALSDSEKKAIEQRASRLFPHQCVRCIWQQDHQLIGGVVLETENVRYAASLQVALRKLSHLYSL